MEQIPVDYTGHGPTGTGYRPTVGAMRRQSENKWRSDRNSEMLLLEDPTINAAIEISQRGLSTVNDPAEVRRQGFDTAVGQAVRDTHVYARRNGFTGHGDPVNTSHNITRGITAGGFTTDTIGKDPTGRSVLGLDQRVSGNGLLSERVTQGFQKNFLGELYGKDENGNLRNTDPNKVNGFDMEETSGVAASIMRRGGVGKAATIVHGADAQTRLNAARDAATPEMREKLAGIKLTKGGDGQKELEKLAAATSDPKLKKELESVSRATSAIVTNDGASKKIAGVVREVTKGMAALGDMYGELSSSDLQQTLESISGQEITNKKQAKAATRMVNQMRNNAEDLGMDPRAYADYVQQTQTTAHQQFKQAGGFDSRSDTATKAVNAKNNLKIQDDATAAHVAQKQAAQDAKDMGIDVGPVKSQDEIALDMSNQQAKQQSMSGGEAMVRGGLDKIDDPAKRKKAEELLAKKDATTDAKTRYEIEGQLKALAGDQWGGKSKTFDAAAASNTGENFQIKGFADEKQIAAARASDTAALTTDSMDSLGVSKLGMKKEDATKFSKTMVSKLGFEGAVDIAKIANGPDQIGDQKITAEDRKKNIQTYLTKTAGYSEDEARDYMDKMTNDEGRFKDKDVAADMTERLQSTSWDGQSVAGQNKAVQKRLDDRGRNSVRKRIEKNDKGGISFSGIANAMIDKKLGTGDDPETQALTLAAMKEEGMTTMMVDAVDGDSKKVAYQDDKDVDAYKKVDLSKGITKQALTDLTKVNGGKSMNLAAKLGYKSDEEMAEKTAKDPKALAAAKKLIDTDASFDKFNSAGTDKTKQINVMDGVQTDINTKDNISVEAAEKLTKANGGKDVGLLKEIGWKDNAEMAEATKKDPKKLEAALKFIEDNNDLTLSGEAGNQTAISDDAMRGDRNNKNGTAQILRMTAAAGQIGSATKGTEGNAITDAIKTGDTKKINAAMDSMFTVDKVGYKTSEGNFSSGRQFTHMDNNRKFVNAAQGINEADDDEMKNIMELNKDGAMEKNMKGQLEALKTAKDRKIDTVIAREGGKEVTNNTDDSIAKLEAAIARLSGETTKANGGQVVNHMTVTELHVGKISDLKKS